MIIFVVPTSHKVIHYSHYPIFNLHIYTQKRTTTWAYPILKPKSMVDPKPTNLPTIRKVKDLATCCNGNVTMTRKVMTFSDDYVMEVGPITSHVIHISSVFYFIFLLYKKYG